MNPREYYDRLIATMPAGADRAVLRVLSFHIGLDNAIKKSDLMSECARIGTHFSDERQVRSVIVEKLRKRGVLICASSGDSGYFIASTLQEYLEFRGREYVKKIVDMRETVTLMDAQARTIFSKEYEDHQKQQAAKAGQPSLL